jgi:hypothetical protein
MDYNLLITKVIQPFPIFYLTVVSDTTTKNAFRKSRCKLLNNDFDRSAKQFISGFFPFKGRKIMFENTANQAIHFLLQISLSNPHSSPSSPGFAGSSLNCGILCHSFSFLSVII